MSSAPEGAVAAAPVSPAESFRTALTVALKAIEPFAMIAESKARNYMEGPIAELIPESRGFEGLVRALETFSESVGAIHFPHKASGAASKVAEATNELRSVAARHAVPADEAPPSSNSESARRFRKAVVAWEGSIAKLAYRLGL